jgi:FAD/FMN-containing dehydrogenase
MQVQLESWGRYPRVAGRELRWRGEEELQAQLAGLQGAIPRGLGRSYGDSALAGTVILNDARTCFLGFAPETGLLRAEAGVSLAEILAVFVPRGWFLPVTPGTKFVTLGGAIAADVHGKNHHGAGSFSDHVREMRVLVPDGRIQTIRRETDPELFAATCGGMGLTGVILDATVQLKPIASAYIQQTTRSAKDLDAVMQLFDEAREATYSVAWIDCLATGKKLGRSVLFTGEHAPVEALERKAQANPLALAPRRKLAVPFDLPAQSLNSWTVRLFNALYYWRGSAAQGTQLVGYDQFFYPLDSIHQWNRIYGRPGFVQYQFVLPFETSRDGMRAVLTEISAAQAGSFLAVLKLFGPGNANWLSFPMRGYTLALDFPATAATFALLDRLDEIVMRYGGRHYLAKDSRMRRDVFTAGYPQIAAFQALKGKLDPERRLWSAQWDRILREP